MTISKRSLLLLTFDIIAILLSYMTASYLRGYGNYISPMHPSLVIALVLFPALFYVFDLYYPYKYFNHFLTLVEITISLTIGMMILAAIFYMDKSSIIGRGLFLISSAMIAWQVLMTRMIYDFIFEQRLMEKRILIFGAGGMALKIAMTVESVPKSGMDIIGFITVGDAGEIREELKKRILGTVDDLVEIMSRERIQQVVLATEGKIDERLFEIIYDRGISITSGTSLYENLKGELLYEFLGNYYLIELSSVAKGRKYLKVKRCMDVVLGVVLSLVLSPIVFFVAFLLKMSGVKRVFFVQKRIGKNNVPFKLLKLRTMIDVKEEKQKIVPMGKWIRKYRLDEIPQLMNVIKGDMSLIGPRPEIPYFVNRSRRLIPFFDVVLSVKPGLTGWAQVKFSHVISISDYGRKFSYNLYYLKHMSFFLDLVIVLQTIRIVLMGKGK